MRDLQIAIQAARVGGKTALQMYGKPHQIQSKGGVDFFSEADLAAESAVRKYLSGHSGYPVFGEEQGGDKSPDRLWVVDGIDGSCNFCSGIPHWGTVIALLDGQTARVSAIYLPALKELYYAEQGEGSFLSRRPPERLRAAEETDPSKLQIAFDLGYEGREGKLGKMARLVGRVRYPPIFGSAAALPYVAAGKLGGYVIWGVDINDTVAGALMVEEAGGIAVNEKGERFDRHSRTLIATANEQVKGFILERIGE